MRMRGLKSFILFVMTIALSLSVTNIVFANDTLENTIAQIVAGRDKEISDGKGNHYTKALEELQKELSSYNKASTATNPDARLINIDGTTNTINLSDQIDLKNKANAKLQDAKAKTLEDVGKTKSVDEVKNDINNMLKEDFNVSADVTKASEALDGFKDTVGIIVGVLAYIVIIGMGLFTALDVCYIVIPVFRSFYTDSAESGNRITGKTGKNGEAKLRWVSDDAVYAVKVATVEEGKSPIKVYLFKRIGAYIIVAIVLFMLLTGNMQIFVNIALDLVSGIIEQLQEMAQ